MADSRALDVALVSRALASPDARVRREATLVAGQTADRSVLPTLRPLVMDSDSGVAANAAFGLGLLVDTASVALLVSTIDGLRPTVAREAVWSLGEIGEPARQGLESALRARSTREAFAAESRALSDGSDVTTALLIAAQKLRPVPVPRITPFLSAPSDRVRWAAAYAISRGRAAAGVRPLLGAARDASGDVRAAVARGLARTAAGDSLGDPAFAALGTLVVDPDPHVRINALGSLATFGAAARTVVINALTDAGANVRNAAAAAAPRVVDSTPDLWKRLWSADTSYMFRRTLLEGAGKIEVLGAELGEWARSSDWRLRAVAASVLFARPSAVNQLAQGRALLGDTDGRVRAAAVGAVAALPESMQVRQALGAELDRALDDPDFGARAAAIGALGARARASDVLRLVATYRRGSTDTANDARLAALRALSTVWRRDSASFDGTALAAVRALPAPEDGAERRAVASLTPLASWRTMRGTPRPIAWYDERIDRYIAPALAGRLPVAELETERGRIHVQLLALDAPLTVDNFTTLANSGFFDGGRFHRVVPNFVAQDGDPRGNGNGGPPYAIRDELNRRRYSRGAVGMALSGPNTGGSQYFLTHSPQPHLDAHYTVFGQLVDGYAALDALVQGDRITRIRVRF